MSDNKRSIVELDPAQDPIETGSTYFAVQQSNVAAGNQGRRLSLAALVARIGEIFEGVVSATPSTVVLRDAAGRSKVQDPVDSLDITNKGWVDSEKLAKSADLADLADAATARTNLGLSPVAESGAYDDLSGKPSLGTAAAEDVGGAASEIPTNAQRDARSSTITGDTTFIGKVTIPAGVDPTDAVQVQQSLSTSAANTFTASNTFTGETNLTLRDFSKSNYTAVAWKKTAAFAVSTNMALDIEIGGVLYSIAEDTALTMPASPTIGQDYAIWIDPGGGLLASANFTVTGDVPAGSRQIGGFHYAPNGNATLDTNGDWANHTGAPGTAVPQINEYSFWDLKWRPSATDPRGLALCPGAGVWAGIYPANNGNVAGKPLHSYGVDPCRHGNPPYKIWAPTPTAYDNAAPMNIAEMLQARGFRLPYAQEFQFLALGTTEQESAGGSGPGNTGEQGTAQNKNRFVSAWGLFDITGVINSWAFDSLPDNTQDSSVSQGRTNNVFRISRFALLGGDWGDGSNSGSRSVATYPASLSATSFGGRGVCDHLVLV